MILVFAVLCLFGWVSFFWGVATAALVCAYVCCVPCTIGIVQLFKDEPRDEA